LSTEVIIKWIDAENFTDADFADVDGIIIPGGFGPRGIEGKINAIRYARENNVPLLGLCLGFQLVVIEYCRNVLGWKDSTSEEMGPGKHVIAIRPEQENVTNLGGTMRLGDCEIDLKKGTRIEKLYGATKIVERHRHRYEVNPAYIAEIEKAGLVFSGSSGTRMEVGELNRDSFFLATQFHPEYKSTPSHPSPPYLGFVEACAKSRKV
ncbi:MAG: gamma-glutamyl-gamma-aminobutyrate hydrolase family protein, partial [Methanomicrobium sp.]|nr:gamma-glutamyl-gamma-aminobutyrate hydrolase family protein [Methanomicrobium sp.]